MILYDWIPTGPIISCIGCGKTFNENRGKSGLRKGADVKINLKFHLNSPRLFYFRIIYQFILSKSKNKIFSLWNFLFNFFF